MKFLATVILIASSAVCNAGETHNCDDLVGWWQGERFEYEVGENVSETSVNQQSILNVAIYDILDLNTAYIKVALESTDCSMVYGQCEGAVHEAIKVPEPDSDDC